MLDKVSIKVTNKVGESTIIGTFPGWLNKWFAIKVVSHE